MQAPCSRSMQVTPGWHIRTLWRRVVSPGSLFVCLFLLRCTLVHSSVIWMYFSDFLACLSSDFFWLAHCEFGATVTFPVDSLGAGNVPWTPPQSQGCMSVSFTARSTLHCYYQQKYTFILAFYSQRRRQASLSVSASLCHCLSLSLALSLSLCLSGWSRNPGQSPSSNRAHYLSSTSVQQTFLGLFLLKLRYKAAACNVYSAIL